MFLRPFLSLQRAGVAPLKQSLGRSFLISQNSMFHTLMSRQNQAFAPGCLPSALNLRPSFLLTRYPMFQFSFRSRSVAARSLKRKNKKMYKMKTIKTAAKRFQVIGGLRNKMFKYKAQGHRHMLMNKSSRNLKNKRKKRILTHAPSIQMMKKLMPYY